MDQPIIYKKPTVIETIRDILNPKHAMEPYKQILKLKDFIECKPEIKVWLGGRKFFKKMFQYFN
jgi:hypothetical protein